MTTRLEPFENPNEKREELSANWQEESAARGSARTGKPVPQEETSDWAEQTPAVDPAEDPGRPNEAERPAIVVACRPLSAAQYQTISRLERKIPRFLWVTVIFLLGAMALNAAGYAAMSGGESGSGIAMATLWILALIAGGFYWFIQYRERKTLRQLAERGLLGENSAEQVVELYGEYLVALTPHSRTVIRYDQATALWETPTLLVLFSENAAVAWQAEDCTPYDGTLLKAYLKERIPASAYHQKGVFWPCLSYPLPLPILRSTDQPVMACTHVPRFSTKLWNEGWFPVCNKALPVWFAVSAVIGVFMTSAYWWDAPLLRLFAPWFLASFFLVCPLLSLLFVFLQQGEAVRALHRAPNGGRKTVWLTRDGVCVEEGANLLFVPRQALSPRYKKWGALVLLPSGALTIPWDQIPDPAVFRQYFASK